MKSRRIFMVAFVLSAFFIPRMGLSETAPEKPKITLKMGTNAPEATGYAVYIKKHISPALERVTNGKAAFDWYWGGIMGGEEDFMPKIRIDQLQGAVFAGPFACPDYAIMQLPFLFNNYDEVHYVQKKIRERTNSLFEKNGLKLFMLIDADFFQIYSTRKAVRTPDDFVKTRFLVWLNRVERETVKGLGANPIPITTPEVVSSMRSRVCDAVMAPAIWWVGSQLYTITNYITASKMTYGPACLTISMKAWNRIPEEYHKPIEEIMLELELGLNEYATSTAKKCFKAMIEYGVEEVRLTPDEIILWKKRTRPVWDELAGKEYSRDLLDEILRHLKEYRSTEAGK